MTKHKKYEDVVKKWPVIDRINAAKKCVEALTHRIQDVLELHAANKIIQYSRILSDQIPMSQAANAFNTFQHAMYSQEVVRLLAVWDRAAEYAVSIPTVVALIDNDDVVDALSLETFNAHAGQGVRHLNPSDDPEIQDAIDVEFAKHELEFAETQAELAMKTLKACIGKVGEIQKRTKTTSIRNLRDHLSHSLSKTRQEVKNEVPNTKYGDEKELLELTVRLIEDLYCWVNGTSFDIAGDCMEKASKCADELWLNCRFDIEKP